MLPCHHLSVFDHQPSSSSSSSSACLPAAVPTRSACTSSCSRAQHRPSRLPTLARRLSLSTSCPPSGLPFGIPFGGPPTTTTAANINIPTRSKGAADGAQSPTLDSSHPGQQSRASAATAAAAAAADSSLVPPSLASSASPVVKQQPASPTLHLSPSTVQASPPTHSRPLSTLSDSVADRPAHLKRTAESRPRSSIACAWCRRSKVKCTNKGQNTVCDTCQKNRRECVYEIHVGKDTASKNGHDASAERSSEAPRPKKRKVVSSSDTVFTDGDYLDPTILTPTVCLDLFNIFEQHFAIDLPFLHAPTFKKLLRNGNFKQLDSPGLVRIYAFLALTVPFHKSFSREARDEADRNREAARVAQQYAKNAHTALFDVEQPTLETTQARLMLTLHEWANRQGTKAFTTLSSAITHAQLLGCHMQADFNPKVYPVCGQPAGPRHRLQGHERWIEEETKRRVFWSCYILDSFLSSSDARKLKIDDDVHIQLPCTERSFKHGKNVRTMALHETNAQFRERKDAVRRDAAEADGKYSTHMVDAKDAKWEDEDQQEILCWYIRALGNFRSITYWAVVDSRRNEQFPPWDSKNSKFYKLRAKLETFIDRLPDEIKLFPEQINTHIEDGTSRSYTHLHCVISICEITLHREWLPFAPFGRDKPEGPIDEPLVKESPPPHDPDYWDKSAQKCFNAARNIIELMWLCHQHGVMVNNPLSGFAIYSSYFTVIWCKFFPNFDTADHLCTDASTKDMRIQEYARRLKLMLEEAALHVRMTVPWLVTVSKLHKFLGDAKKEYKRHVEQIGSPESNSSGSADIALPPLPGLDDYTDRFERFQKLIFEHGSGSQDDSNDSRKKADIDFRDGLEVHSETCSPAPLKVDDDERTVAGSPANQPQNIGPPPSAWNAVNSSKTENVMSNPPTPRLDVNGNPSSTHYSAPSTYYTQPPPIPSATPSHYASIPPAISYGPMNGQPPMPPYDYQMPTPQQQYDSTTYMNFSEFGHSEGHQMIHFTGGNEGNVTGAVPFTHPLYHATENDLYFGQTFLPPEQNN
ncbi:unnamed protein product [Periconia digitata]|uniref:Zn(2)-C6 fungal-type domain-containing protein n=1 Tax=Periconia digitata TaxID=1303443 RepID=A0A9W4U3G9_9PLEO|nr:unnamed protein product [Periconia digitata]